VWQNQEVNEIGLEGKNSFQIAHIFLGPGSAGRTPGQFRSAEGEGFERHTTGARPPVVWRANLRYAPVGGGGGIRTPGTVSRTLVFKTSALNHSATPPRTGILSSILSFDCPTVHQGPDTIKLWFWDESIF
jgi:hypothetical protein